MMTARPSLELGWRLAIRSTGHGRVRAAMVLLASALGSALLLSVLAVAGAVRAERVPTHGNQTDSVVLGGAILAVLLPVAVLAATVGRLSAALREHRLRQLRLMGMTRGDVAWVGVGEAGVLSLAGWLGGVLTTLLALPLLARLPVGGRTYSVSALIPEVPAYLVSFLLVPVLVTLLAAWPSRGSGRDRRRPLARLAGARGAGWWRTLPLLTGLVLCTIARRPVTVADGQGGGRDLFMLGGIALLGLGAVLVIPVFVRMLATLLVRAGSPTAWVAGRRLQAQPAAMTRVLSALLLGLFLITGARGVAVAFEELPQYAYPRYEETVESSNSVGVPEGQDPDDVAARLREMDGVRDAVVTRSLMSQCDDPELFLCEMGGPVLVASCADLERVAPGVQGCRDDRAAWLYPPELSMPQTLQFSLHGVDESQSSSMQLPLTPALSTASVQRTDVVQLPATMADRLSYDFFVPEALPGAGAAARQHGQVQVAVRADPTRDLFGQLEASGFRPTSQWDLGEYDTIRRMVDGIRLLSMVVLGVGLISFGIGALDRAMARRREVVRLQLLGTPGRTLLLSHWLEVGLPLLLGTMLSILLGWYAGDTYLGFADYDNGALGFPADFVWPLVIAALIGAVLVAAVTSIAASPRIRAADIRTA